MWSHRLSASIRGLAFSSDGRTLYTADNSCRIYAWDPVARTRRLVLKHEFISGVVPDGLLGTGRFLVFLNTDPLRVWDCTAEAKRLDVPERFTARGTQVDATRGRLLALGADGKSVLSWDLERQRRGPAVVRWNEPVRERWRSAFRLSDDGRILVIEASRGQVTFRDALSGAEVGRMPPQSEWVSSTPMLLSPAGRTMCCITGYRWRLWNVPAGTVRFDPWPTPLAFHPTAPVCAAAMSGGLALVSLQTGEAIRSFDFGLGTALYAGFSPDGLTCAVGGSNKQFAVFDVDL